MLLRSTGLRVFANPRVARAEAYSSNGRGEVLNLSAFEQAKREITSWPGYHPTPLRRLSKLASAARIAEILYKDESGRFGIGSFKALGGAYAVLRVLQRHIFERAGVQASASDIASPRYSHHASSVTVTAATDGNHGRSVAWGARMFGCRCVIYLPDSVSEGRIRAIEAYGAQVKRIPGTFDDAVRKAASDAAKHGWQVVPDTSSEGGGLDVPRNVMQGYTLLIDEAASQCPALPSHVFVQAGVGGLAAAVCAYLWERYGTARPRLVVVERWRPTTHRRSTAWSSRRRLIASFAAPGRDARHRRKARSTPSWAGLPAAKFHRSPGRFLKRALTRLRPSTMRRQPIAWGFWRRAAAVMIRLSRVNQPWAVLRRCCWPALTRRRAGAWVSRTTAASW